MAKVLNRTLFGNPILRHPAARLTKDEILSAATQDLITDIRQTLTEKKYGIGLAAAQVGQGIALSVIHIRPTKLRPNLPKEKWADLVIINPKIVKTYGNKKQLHEGCVSLPGVYAKVPRHKKIQLSYFDEAAQRRVKDFEGLLAHVIQHEVDHLEGILYVDRVVDTKTYMSEAEYRKRVVN